MKLLYVPGQYPLTAINYIEISLDYTNLFAVICDT